MGQGEVLPGSGVVAPLCKFSMDEQGVDAVTRIKWNFSNEDEIAKFLAEVERRGPPCCGCTVRAGDDGIRPS